MSIENFIEDIPPKPSPLHTLDRIDNDKGYEPGNVRWATKREQQNNRGCNIRIEAFGKTLTIREWERELGKSKSMFHCRVRRKGGTMRDAVIHYATRDGYLPQSATEEKAA